MAIIFDVETTGLITSTDAPLHTQPKIIELFALKVCDETFEITGELEMLVDPKEALSEEIVKVTGLTDADVKGQGEFPAHLPAVQNFWLGERYVIGHNVVFDCDMLEVELRRLGQVNRFPWTPRRLCTVELSEHYFGRRIKLVDLHTHLLGEAFEQAHRARNDVMATYRCAKEMRKRGDLLLE